ncbi:DUF805 domain-containing protein [Erythrobacter sp. YJ-T3-07]|uniref:DUF805 domain-containing protein n=1 Tax=Erythrobacter sp. YJ-T3-07 TaxID=2793063 RepID=UPI0018D33320|nr:DUF805 domain-containing protein [Erythrobacter sp. YJ-T3-07]MBH1943292.1 DUF805 domain-containing protein [Erythrobacter sp. YJ-T3-07]
MKWMALPLKRYADFSGRSRRKEYWAFQLGQLLFYLVIFVLIGMTADPAQPDGGTLVGDLLGIPVLLFWLGLIIPNLAVTVRRLHDHGKSGWWILIGLIPLGGIVLLVFMLIEGTPGTNEYGADPRESVAQTFA